MTPADLPPRLSSKFTIDESGCWVWTASFSRDGYGRAWLNGRTLRAHRVVYTLLVGDIPPGHEIDHLCRVTSCVNPAHLEPVTGEENNARFHRMQAAANVCRRGHEYTPENTIPLANGYRKCRTCDTAYQRAYQADYRKGIRRRPAA